MGDSEQLRDAAIAGVRWSSIARPATEVVLFAAMIALTRLIAPAEFGRYAIALIAQELAAVIASEGVGAAIVQRRECRRGHLQAGMALATLIGLALTGALLVLAATAVSAIFGQRTAGFVGLMAPLCLILGLGTVPVAMLRRQMRFRRLSEIELASAVVRVAFAVALALSGLGGVSLVLGSLAGGIAITMVAWASAPPPLPSLRWREASELLRYGLPAALAGISWVGFRNSDYAIVGARLGALQAGLYFRAYTLAIDYQKKVSVVMSQVGFPLLSQAHRGDGVDRDVAAGLRHQMVMLLTLTLFPALCLLAIASPLLVPMLFGPRWQAMVVPAQILALGGAATLVIDAAGTTLMAAGRTRAILAFGVAHWLAYAGSVLLVCSLGIVAVAIAAAVVHSVFTILAYWLMQDGAGERPLRCLWRDVAPATISCVGLALAALPVSLALAETRLPAIVQLAVVAATGATGYLLALRVCFPATSHWLLLMLERMLPERRGLRWAKQRLALAATGARSAL